MIKGVLFMDIETVPVTEFHKDNEVLLDFLKRRHPANELNAEWEEWGPSKTNELWEDKAGLYAETGKVVCVSFAFVTPDGSALRIKSIASAFEKELLKGVAEVMSKFVVLCAHNGKEFDWPFLYRRYVINGMDIPDPLNVAGKKPWEVPHIDTMDLWKHLQWKHRVSLDVLANIFGLPSPKQNFSGADVAEVFYERFKRPDGELPFDKEESALKQISDYCNKDVLTLVQVYCKMKGLPLFTTEQIQYA